MSGKEKNWGLRSSTRSSATMKPGFFRNNIFENYHHRTLVQMLRMLRQTGRYRLSKEAELLRTMSDNYGVSQMLDDGTLSPVQPDLGQLQLQGRSGIPTPLSSHVEERWFNHDFLETIYIDLGYDPAK